MGGKIDAVFEGGGVRGIGLVGAVSVIERAGYTFEHVAGTSAGSIVAALIAAGYNARELTDIMKALDYTKFTDRSRLDKIPLIGPTLSILLEKGMYEGDFLVKWLGDLLAKKGVRTFRDLVHPDKECRETPKYRHRLQVMVSDLSAGFMVQLPLEAKRYGIDPDELEVARAVRMSMSIPFFFEPVTLPCAGTKHYIVDGGLLSNFPVKIFDSEDEPPWPTFGFRLVAGQVGRNEIKGTASFAIAMAKTLFFGHDNRHVEDADYVRTIPIQADAVNPVNFKLSPDARDALYKEGERAARKFLDEWSFERYKASFRKGERQSRGTRLRGA